jgi:carbonic anhydrase/acetyltransferase-like protein (isoleucine patch superfamily)
VPILLYLEHTPEVDQSVQLAEDAYVVGKVKLAGPALLERSAVLRGNQNAITIGPRFRIGAESTVHVEEPTATHIGQDVWVGDDAVVHACWLGDGVRVEDGAIVLSGASVGSGSIVAAGALVPENASFPDNSYITGTPGRRVRETTHQERQETLDLLGAVFSR